MKPPDAKDWSIYWKRPTVTSFGDIFPRNYDGAILEFWKEQLAGEPDHVIDIACGNGALTWIANDILNGAERKGRQKTKITGVDFASISPFKTLNRKKADYPSVRFRGNTPAENLPFRDGSIDAVISQYGVEYTDLERTIPEIARVLTPDGKMCFILHGKESVIVKGATLNLEGFRKVLYEVAPHEPVANLVELRRTVRTPEDQQRSAEYQALLAQIREAVAVITGWTRNFPPPSALHLYMDRLNYALNDAQGKPGINQQALVDEARNGLQAYIERVEDLEAAALSDADLLRLVAMIERQGFDVAPARTLLYEGDKDFGTTIVARRRT